MNDTLWTPKPTVYAPATWKCGHVDEWPVNMLKNNRHLVEAKACPECRAVVQRKINEANEAIAVKRAKANREALESRAQANGITADQQELREYFAKNGCE